MSQNEEDNVFTFINSTNSTVSESLSLAMGTQDSQELSFQRPMSTDNGPQLSSVTWLMPAFPGQRLSPSIMMQLALGDDPQLQSSSTWPMAYEPNQQPMTPSQYYAVQTNYVPEMQPMPPSRHAARSNKYRHQMQPMPSMTANGDIPHTPTPWIGSMVPHNPSFLHRDFYSFNQYYNGEQLQPALHQRRSVIVQNMQFEEFEPQSSPSLEQQFRGVEQMQFSNPMSQVLQFLQQPQSAADHRHTIGRRPDLLSLQQQHHGVEQMQFEDPRSQWSSALQQQHYGVEQMQFENSRSQSLQFLQQLQSSADRRHTLRRRSDLLSLQQQHRGVGQMQFEDPRSQGSSALQQQHYGVEQMQFENSRSQSLQFLQQLQSSADRRHTLRRRSDLLSLQQQHRGVEQMQFEDPMSQALQFLQQPQSPVDRRHMLGQRQRPWTSYFQRPGNEAVGRTMAMECRQLNGTIQFCSACNALLPANNKPPATHGENNSCKVTALLPDNCTPLFECHVCKVRIRMENIEDHMATARHDKVPDKDGEQYMSFFCGDCNIVLYAPLRVFIEHLQSLHYSPSHPTLGLSISVPSALYVMYELMRDFLLNGRDIVLYSCLSCKYTNPSSRYRGRGRCAVCAKPENTFYCQYCNVVFYATQAGYDKHRFTFEHFYFMYHRWVRSNAAVHPVEFDSNGRRRGGGGGRGRGVGRGRGGGGGRGRGVGRGRGSAAGNGIASASKQQ